MEHMTVLFWTTVGVTVVHAVASLYASVITGRDDAAQHHEKCVMLGLIALSLTVGGALG